MAADFQLSTTSQETLLKLQEQVRADSLILWIRDQQTASLVALFAPSIPQLTGFRQPLTKGFISQSFLTGLPLLEGNLQSNTHYDPEFDERSGRLCRAIMAVPVAGRDDYVGILSAAQFLETNHGSEFSTQDLTTLQQGALALSPDLSSHAG